jgi:hypothetical protein
MIAEQKNRLYREKSRKRESRQGQGVSLQVDNDDEDVEDTKNNNDDMVALDAPQGSGDTAEPSGARCLVGASDEGATRKRPPLSLP